MKILVADDDAVNRKFLRTLLISEGHTVAECADGLAALEYVQQNPCDAVISDVLMPRMDGYRLCYEIRQRKRLRNLSLILYTASYLSEADEKAALAMGADKFIRKPALPEVIVRALNEAVKGARARQVDDVTPPSELTALREYSEVLVRKLEETNIELSVANAILAESERRLRAIIESEPECLEILSRHGILLEINPAGLRMIEADSAAQALGDPVYPLIDPRDRAAFAALNEAVFRGESGTLEFEIVGFKGSRRYVDTHMVPLRNSEGDIVAALGITRDVTERRLNARLLEDQMRVLEMIARGDPLPATLDALLRAVEAQSEEMICSVALFDAERRRVRHAAAPRLPKGYQRAVESAAIGDNASPCGAAALLRATVTADDMETDPRWPGHRETALRHGLRACWATPLFDSRQEVIATFAAYFRRPGRPSESQQRLIATATHIAAIAVGKSREETALRASEARFREMADSAPAMIWITRPDGAATYINKQWYEFTGQSLEAPLGFGWLDALHPDDRERAGKEFRAANERHGAFTTEYRLRRHDGTYRWVIDSGLPRFDDNGEFLGYIGSVFDITERKQAEDERQRSLERVRALHEVNLAITSTMNRQSQLDVLLEKIEKFFPYPTVSTIRLLQRETGRLESLAQRGLDAEAWSKRERSRTLHRALTVVETRAPVVIADVRSDAVLRGRPMPSSFGLVSYAGIPLIARGEVLGVLGVYTKTAHKFSGDEIEFLTTVAGQAAIAIYNAQLYEEAQRRRREAEELARIARSLTETLDMKAVGERVAGSVLELFKVKGATLRLLRPDGSLQAFVEEGEAFSRADEAALVPSGTGLAGRALAEGKPIWSANVLKEPNLEITTAMRDYVRRCGNASIIAVPLRVRDESIGVIILADTTGRSYFQSEVDLLQVFADQVALALHNARLFEQAERDVRRLRALREIEQAVTSTLDLQSVLRLLLDKMDVFLPFHAATTIRLFDRASGKFLNTACRNIDEHAWKTRVGRGTKSRSGQILKTKRPAIVPDMRDEPGVAAAQFYREYGFVSYLGVPLLAKDEVVGILGFYTREPHDFTAQEIDLLLTLAGQAAIAIQNAQLYEQIDRSKQELEAINRSLESSLRQLNSLYAALSPIAAGVSMRDLMEGIIDRLIEVTGADAALIRLLDRQTGRVPIVAHRGFSEPYLGHVREAPAGGAIAWTIEHGEPIIVPDIAAEPRLKGKVQLQLGLRSCAILPIHLHGDMHGVLHLASRSLDHYNEGQRNHLSAIARQMSIAIENRELFAEVTASRDELARAIIELSESNRRLSALHAVADAASQSMSLQRVLDRAVEKITDIFDFEATRIHLCIDQTDEIVRRASVEKNPERFAGNIRFQKGQGVVGRVVETGEPLVFEDIQTDRSYKAITRTNTASQSNNHFFAVFPIKSKARVLGAMSCLGSAPRKLAPGEFQLLEALTDQLAVAIENTGLYEALRAKVDELQRKTHELERANRVKDEFLGVVSHELRTPMNVIIGYISIFKEGVFGEITPAQREALAKIARESAELLSMINTLLYVTSLESEPLTLESQIFNPENLLAEMRANYAVTVPREIALDWQYPEVLPPLDTDRRKLRQILDNLIGNALKFTSKGTVTVAVRLAEDDNPDGTAAQVAGLRLGAGDNANGDNAGAAPSKADARHIEFTVADTGIGIPRDNLARIFDKFYQVDSSEKRYYGGVGLGLYIAKRFADLLGGTLAVQSVEGQGSAFTLRLPIEGEPGGAPASPTEARRESTP